MHAIAEPYSDVGLSVGRDLASHHSRNDGEVRLTREALLDQELLFTILDAIPFFALVLNSERQILAANTRTLNTFSREDLGSLIGKRPGEAIGCLFDREGVDGCGSGPHCGTCGALRSILESQHLMRPVTRECSILLKDNLGTAMDLEVVSTPTVIEGIPVVICVLKDISAEKRRDVLERVFFHDVINTAGGIKGIASLLAEGKRQDDDKEQEYKRWLLDLSDRLIDEILLQRKLVAAESGEFKPEMMLVSVPMLMEELLRLYVGHEVAEGRTLQLGEVAACHIVSDSAILRRILGNLVKNALEATPAGGTVTLSSREEAGEVAFIVHNPGIIPPEVAPQLFRRSFSTKTGAGRGIGTYSIKLFGERYLGGKVSFESSAETGTVFKFSLPVTNS